MFRLYFIVMDWENGNGSMSLCKSKGISYYYFKNTEKITYFCSICLRNGLLWTKSLFQLSIHECCWVTLKIRRVRGRKENKGRRKERERSFALLPFLEGRLSADHFDRSPVYLSKWLFVLSQCLEQLQGKGLFTLLHHIELIYFYNCGQLEKELGNKIWIKIKRTGKKVKDFKTRHNQF